VKRARFELEVARAGRAAADEMFMRHLGTESPVPQQ
jgi:hypothetical protein